MSVAEIMHSGSKASKLVKEEPKLNSFS
jgi:NAD-dependent deacetylase